MAVNKLVNNEGLDVIFYLLDVTNKDHIKTISKQIEQQYGNRRYWSIMWPFFMILGSVQ